MAGLVVQGWSLGQVGTDWRRASVSIHDGWETGLYSRPEAMKRLDTIEAERAALRDLQAQLSEDITVDPAVLGEIASTFATWSFLSRPQKRKLLKSYGARVTVERPKRGEIQVVGIDLQSVANGSTYLWRPSRVMAGRGRSGLRGRMSNAVATAKSAVTTARRTRPLTTASSLA